MLSFPITTVFIRRDVTEKSVTIKVPAVFNNVKM